MNSHLPQVLVVAPNIKARKLGMVNELRVGWRHNRNNVVRWWGSCGDREALAKLLDDVRKRYGQHITVEERESDEEPGTHV